MKLNFVLFGAIRSIFVVSVAAQFQQHYHVNVTPTCEQQTIKVVLTFNEDDWPNGQFEDWIIVGSNDRTECRLKGNGELQYVIELSIFNDPCQTHMPSTGVFQNRIRIGKNPAIILLGDKTFIIKCIYGTPEITKLEAPSINPSFKAVSLPESLRDTKWDGSVAFVASTADVKIGEVTENQDFGDADDDVFISWTVLSSIIGGLSFFVLTLIFIFICFRWRLASKEKTCGAPAIAHNGNTINKFAISDLWWHDKKMIKRQPLSSMQTSNERSSTTAHSKAHMSSSLSSGSSFISEQNPVNAHLSRYSQQQSTTTDSTNTAAEDSPQSYSEWRSRILANLSNKHMHNNVNLDRCSSVRTNNAALVNENQLSEVRSITEIYRSAEMAMGEADTLSQSTFEDVSFNPSHHCSYPSIESLAQCVGKIRGIGPRKITEQEYGRWRRLVTSDVSFREALFRTRDSKQIEQICFGSEYKKLFTKEKWNAIIRCIVEQLQQQQQQHNGPTRHYTKRSDDLQQQDMFASSVNVYVGDVGSSGW